MTNIFEIFLKTFEVLEDSANEDFAIDYFEKSLGYTGQEGLTLTRDTFELI